MPRARLTQTPTRRKRRDLAAASTRVPVTAHARILLVVFAPALAHMRMQPDPHVLASARALIVSTALAPVPTRRTQRVLRNARSLVLISLALGLLTSFRAHADAGPFASPPSVESLVATIDACRERLDPQLDIGFERIAARCPDLARRLEQNELAAWLPEGWKDTGNNLSVGSLQELAILMRREITTHSSRPAPRVQRLHEVLTEIGQAREHRDSLWKRLRLWMHKVLPSNEEPTDNGWIPRMVSRIGLPQTVIEVVSYIALASIIMLGLFILANEFRAAGIFRRGSVRKAVEPARLTPVIEQMSWLDVERASLADKPRVVLELLIDRLTRAHLLPPARSLTNRELTRAVTLPNAKDQDRLQALALTAERMRYAPAMADPAEVEAAVAGGRVILRSLDPAIEDDAR